MRTTPKTTAADTILAIDLGKNKSVAVASRRAVAIGIPPAVIDRCLQAMVKNALEPEWETRFEGTSYGFRPGRGCHDAIQKIYMLARSNKRKKWIVDADIKGAFDSATGCPVQEPV
jgi:hypothetical protein